MPVTLSSYSFDRGSPPTINSSGIALTDRYKLRAKFQIPAYGNAWQATDLWNNDGLRLDNLPEDGTWVVDLYAILYNDTTGTFSTTAFNTVSVTVSTASSPCLNPDTSTQCRCGDFPEPDVAEVGACMPAATHRTCEAPPAPQAECGEQNFTVEYRPGETPPFVVTSILFDQSCEVILDQDGNPILTIVG